MNETTTNTNNEELSKEEEENILSMTDDIEIYGIDQNKPVPKQDHNEKRGTKKLGLRGNSNKFNPPSGAGLLPTPSNLSFVRSPYTHSPPPPPTALLPQPHSLCYSDPLPSSISVSE